MSYTGSITFLPLVECLVRAFQFTMMIITQQNAQMITPALTPTAVYKPGQLILSQLLTDLITSVVVLPASKN